MFDVNSYCSYCIDESDMAAVTLCSALSILLLLLLLLLLLRCQVAQRSATSRKIVKDFGRKLEQLHICNTGTSIT